MLTVVDGLRFQCTQEGQGTDLILIHGLGGSLHDWDACTPDLARYHRVLRWDVRGFGDSDKPPGPYSPQLFARDLAGLAHACGVTRAHVGGETRAVHPYTARVPCRGGSEPLRGREKVAFRLR